MTFSINCDDASALSITLFFEQEFIAARCLWVGKSSWREKLSSAQVLSFGGSGFTPVAGDDDGDGKTDAAMYHQSTGNWFVVGSTSGFFPPVLGFGNSGFVPVLPQVTILRAMGLL